MRSAVRCLPTPRQELARRAIVAGLGVLAALGILLIALLANASLLAVTAGAEPAPERFVLRGDRVEISDLAGSVRVVAGTGTRTEVIVTRGGPDAGELRVLQDEVGGTSRLRVGFAGRTLVYPGRGRSGRTTLTVDRDGCLSAGHGLGLRRLTIKGGGLGPQAWADLEVRLPRGQKTVVRLGVGGIAARDAHGELTLDVGSASVEAGGTSGRLDVDAGSGTVTVSSHRGDLRVDTGSGPVEITDVAGGRLDVDTGSGRVTGSNLEADGLDVDTGSGEVRFEDLRARSIRVDTGSGGVRLDLAGAPESVLVDTGSGGVTISGPPDLGARVDLDTGSGRIEIGYPVIMTSREHGSLRGTIGDGRALIQVDTGSGGVRIAGR